MPPATKQPKEAKPFAIEELKEPKLLLGEGLEEQRFFSKLLESMPLGGIQVGQFAGNRKLREFLRALKNWPQFGRLQAIAITRDAETDANAAFQSVQDALRNAGLPFPAQPGAFAAGPPRVGVLIIPPNQPNGMLEDLCLASVRSDPAMICVEEYMKCVEEKAKRQPGNPAKAKVHAWLASQVDPDKRLGEAAQAGYWRMGDSVFDSVRQFLRGL